MILYIRFAFHILLAYLSPKIRPSEKTEVSLRAWPIDCDFKNLNGSRFYSFMDIAQHTNNVRTGFISQAIAEKWYVVSRSSKVTFYKRFPIFSVAKISAQVISWDDKFFYWENEFHNRKGELIARGHSKVSVRKKSERVSPKVILNLFDIHSPPQSPEKFQKLLSDS